MSSLDLLYGSNKSWPTFKPVNDTIRGGKSTSSFLINPSSNIATFSGHLDITALGGAGFSSQSTTYDSTRLSLPRSTYSGISLSLALPSLKGKEVEEKQPPSNPTKFVLILKNIKPSTRPDGRRESITSYEFEFDVEELLFKEGGLKGVAINEEEEEEEIKRKIVTVSVEAEWKDFKPNFRGRPQTSAPVLDPSNIYQLSIMCRSNFGKQNGKFSIDLVSLSAVVRHSSERSPGLAGYLERMWYKLTNWLFEMRLWITGGSSRRDGALRLD